MPLQRHSNLNLIPAHYQKPIYQFRKRRKPDFLCFWHLKIVLRRACCKAVQRCASQRCWCNKHFLVSRMHPKICPSCDHFVTAIELLTCFKSHKSLRSKCLKMLKSQQYYVSRQNSVLGVFPSGEDPATTLSQSLPPWDSLNSWFHQLLLHNQSCRRSESHFLSAKGTKLEVKQKLGLGEPLKL